MQRTREILRLFTGVGLSCYVLLSTFIALSDLQAHPLFLLLVLAIAFLKSPKGGPEKWCDFAVDLLFSLLVVLCFGYVIIQHEVIADRAGIVTQLEMVLGIATCLLVLESTRRTVGWALVVITMIFLLYAFAGEYLPSHLGGHGGFGMKQVIGYTYLSENGIFGQVTYVLFRYVFLFIMFGKLLEQTGVMRFVGGLALALVGRFRGGPALVAVISSGLIGSVTGSPVGNVMVTGTVTIPLMKRIGYKPHVAAAIEAAASTGGQFMPPVMGATAFLIMQFLGISYLRVISAALIPAILYFLAVLVSVYLHAIRSDIHALAPHEVPPIGQVVRQYRWEGLTFFGAFTVLVMLLVLRYSPIMAALSAMVAAAVLSLPSKQRLTPEKVILVLKRTAEDFVMLGAAGACVGILIATVLLTGLAMRLSGVIIGLAGGALFPVLVFSMISCIILGTALPAPIAYILLATMIAPGIVRMGVPPLAAHLFIFYAAIMAFVTPPVGIAAYAAATIAQTGYFRTGLKATLISIVGYIVPFIFIQKPALLMMDHTAKIVMVSVSAFLGISFLAAAITGAISKAIEVPRRACFLMGGILLIISDYRIGLLGLLLGLLPLGTRQALVGGKEVLRRAFQRD